MTFSINHEYAQLSHYCNSTILQLAVLFHFVVRKYQKLTASSFQRRLKLETPRVRYFWFVVGVDRAQLEDRSPPLLQLTIFLFCLSPGGGSKVKLKRFKYSMSAALTRSSRCNSSSRCCCQAREHVDPNREVLLPPSPLAWLSRGG